MEELGLRLEYIEPLFPRVAKMCQRVSELRATVKRKKTIPLHVPICFPLLAVQPLALLVLALLFCSSFAMHSAPTFLYDCVVLGYNVLCWLRCPSLVVGLA